MRKVCLSILIFILLISCSGTVENTTADSTQKNESISGAIAVLESVKTSSDLTITLSGNATQNDLLLFKEAILAVELRNLGKGYLTIDMTDLSDVQELDASYFGNLNLLKAVKLPKSLTEVPKYIFFNCKNLKEVTIQENTKCIGYAAFGDCENIETVYIKTKTLEMKQNAFSGVNTNIKLDTPQDFVAYNFESSVFDASLFDTFIKILPTNNAFHVSRTFITEKGNQKTLNLSMKYTYDDKCLYTLIGNDDQAENNPKKIVTMLIKDDEHLDSGTTDIDGILPCVTQTKNQKITIQKPTDQSTWYYTIFPDVFYSWNKDEAKPVTYKNDSITINTTENKEIYYFKVK